MLEKVYGILQEYEEYISNAKEQKKASRVADMLAINEMQDYRNFR